MQVHASWEGCIEQNGSDPNTYLVGQFKERTFVTWNAPNLLVDFWTGCNWGCDINLANNKHIFDVQMTLTKQNNSWSQQFRQKMLLLSAILWNILPITNWKVGDVTNWVNMTNLICSSLNFSAIIFKVSWFNWKWKTFTKVKFQTSKQFWVAKCAVHQQVYLVDFYFYQYISSIFDCNYNSNYVLVLVVDVFFALLRDPRVASLKPARPRCCTVTFLNGT